MSNVHLLSHHYSLSSTNNAAGRRRQPLFPAAHVRRSTTTTIIAKAKCKVGQMVIKPSSSPKKLLVHGSLVKPLIEMQSKIDGPIGRTDESDLVFKTLARTPGSSVISDPDLVSTWPHRAWVASGCATVLISLVKCATGCVHSHMLLEPLLAGLIGYVLADLGSGVYHWGIDNYGDASTPVFGSQIEAFQGHHKWPWTITRRQFANNLHALARAVTFTVLPLDLAFDDPVMHGFVGVCSGCIMLSQQFHAWAHGTKSRLPPVVVALQDAGLLVSRSQHAAHHRAPYNNNYCIVSGVWNQFLDENKVFEALEMIFFFKLGVQPRSWSQPSHGWTEEVETPSQTTVQ